MNKSFSRVVLGCALAVTPWIYHLLKMSGERAAQFEQSEALILFGREISKGQYFGLLAGLSLVGIMILAVGIKGMSVKAK